MTRASALDTRWLQMMAASAFLLASLPAMHLHAQGLESQRAIETIIGSTVEQEEVAIADDAGRVIAAIEKSDENAAIVRRITNLDKVDIVFLSDATVTEGGLPQEIDDKIKANADAVTRLRQELEGNAMLYHAINSHRVLIRDVLGLEFDEGRTAVVFAAAKPPAQ